MPKDTFYGADDETIGVHWYNFPERKPEPIEPLVAVSIGQGVDFTMDDEPDIKYDRMWFNFDNPKELERFIKTLRRAGRKVWGYREL
jgi:hypothetical protein